MLNLIEDCTRQNHYSDNRLYRCEAAHPISESIYKSMSIDWPSPGNTKEGSIIVLLTSCLTGLEPAVRQLTIFVLICITD